MSVESLIFIGIFILLPLLERLMEWRRERQSSAPPGDVVMTPKVPAPPRRRPGKRPVPRPAVPSTAPDPGIRVKQSVRESPSPPRLPAARTAGHSSAVSRILRSPRSLRRAMLVSSLLGPCKALEPDWEPPGASAGVRER